MSTTEERRKWLEYNQYTKNGILRYERIFGTDFISTGGLQTTKDVVALLDLKPGMKVLDVGCGIGGSAFYMAQNFGVTVDGVDLSTNTLDYAKHKLETVHSHLKDKVTFTLHDVLTIDIPENTYDVIYSRDAIMHIDVPDKKILYSLFHKWLKPGGKVLVTEYCHGDKEEHSEEYLAYVRRRNYFCLSVKDYVKLLEDIFPKVEGKDITSKFVEFLEREMADLESQKDSFVQDFSMKDYDELMDDWRGKGVRAGDRDQAWGLFTATKQ